MDLGLGGKVAWVTGASSGLGLATAEALRQEGARVAISARSADELERVAGDTGCMAVPVDVTDPQAITQAHQRVADELGPVDILVANAGGPPPGGFDAFEDEQLYEAFTLTTASAWRLTKAVLPTMTQKESGVLLYLTSGSTKEVIPGLLLSNMMRAAVVGMAKTLSKELGAQGIRSLCVAPGRIHTKRLDQLDEARAETTSKSVEEVRAEITATIPLGRYGAPEEFGATVAFLASERASYLTGVTVVVDGGMLNGLLS